MSTVNNWTGLGRLGRDADVRSTKRGREVMNFSMATNHVWRDAQGEIHEETEWHTIVFWAKGEERSHANLAPYMTKGKQVMVSGRIRTREWKDRNGERRYRKEIIADVVIMTGSRPTDASTEKHDSASEPDANKIDSRHEMPDTDAPDPDPGADFDDE